MIGPMSIVSSSYICASGKISQAPHDFSPPSCMHLHNSTEVHHSALFCIFPHYSSPHHAGSVHRSVGPLPYVQVAGGRWPVGFSITAAADAHQEQKPDPLSSSKAKSSLLLNLFLPSSSESLHSHLFSGALTGCGANIEVKKS